MQTAIDFDQQEASVATDRKANRCALFLSGQLCVDEHHCVGTHFPVKQTDVRVCEIILHHFYRNHSPHTHEYLAGTIDTNNRGMSLFPPEGRVFGVGGILATRTYSEFVPHRTSNLMTTDYGDFGTLFKGKLG